MVRIWPSMKISAAAAGCHHNPEGRFPPNSQSGEKTMPAIKLHVRANRHTPAPHSAARFRKSAAAT
jgi:hypothetical protein